MLKFCVSLSWRTLHFYRAHIEESWSREDLSKVDEAEDTWRAVLLGNAPHPGRFRQHFLPFDRIESFSDQALPSNFNRYILRSIDLDVVRADVAGFTYSKFGRFLVLGIIWDTEPGIWRGTKVHANEGTVEPRRYQLPAPLWDFLKAKAARAAEIQAGISPKQKAKIEGTFRADLDRLRDSDFAAALNADVEIFGAQAFTCADPKVK